VAEGESFHLAALDSIPGANTRHMCLGAGLWRSSFDAHGRDQLCERPSCGCLHSIFATLDQISWCVQAHATPDVATSKALASEESSSGGERVSVTGFQMFFLFKFCCCSEKIALLHVSAFSCHCVLKQFLHSGF